MSIKYPEIITFAKGSVIIVTLRKIGKSAYVVLPPEILQYLSIKPGDKLVLVTKKSDTHGAYVELCVHTGV
jgi:bifunctional DNA-binding transcriptional regulator/antitoxin component of YhaV-PrlF toxin-antitoxin module